MNITRVFDILDNYKSKEKAIIGKKNGEWKSYSDKDYKEKANNFSYGLLNLGIKKMIKLLR